MWPRIFSLLVTYFAGKFIGQHPTTSETVKGLSVAIMKKMTAVLATIVFGSIIFFGGFFTVLVDLILTSYTAKDLAVTSVSWVGGGLMLVSVLTFAMTMREGFWRTSEATPEIKVSPLNAALAHLVNDFVAERQTQRSSARTEPSSMMNGTHTQPYMS